MGFWAMIPAIAGMAGQAAGGRQQRAATIEGAETQAEIERMNRDYQRELFEKEQARQKPYYEMGLQNALPMVDKYLQQGQVSQEQMPLYRMQKDAGLNALAEQNVGGYGRERFMEGLNATEQDATYNRLMDALKFGLGASSAAGAGASNFAGSYMNSLARGNRALSAGESRAASQRQSMYSNLAGQASSIPAYSYLQNTQTNTIEPSSGYNRMQNMKRRRR